MGSFPEHFLKWWQDETNFYETGLKLADIDREKVVVKVRVRFFRIKKTGHLYMGSIVMGVPPYLWMVYLINGTSIYTWGFPSMGMNPQ